MLLEHLRHKRIILASGSPRRRQLLAGLEVEFEVRTPDVPEDFPPGLAGPDIPLYLARLKAQALRGGLGEEELLITADTIVWVNDHVLNKPADAEEARAMLRELSGRAHTVYTAVVLSAPGREVSFWDETRVHFAELTEAEMDYYIHRYRPFDKAGAYGVQEFIGYIGIRRLEGSYFNVMGLPVQRLYEALRDW